MSAPEGQEPPQVPHWMHISRRESPAVLSITSSRKDFWGVTSTTGGPACVGLVIVLKGYLLASGLLFAPRAPLGATARGNKQKGFYFSTEASVKFEVGAHVRALLFAGWQRAFTHICE